MTPQPPEARLDAQVREWNVAVETTRKTASSLLAFGTRSGQPVTLKVLRARGEEWRMGEVLEAFDGRGTVRALAHVPGAVLLERLEPGTSLVPLVLEGRDDEATEIIADVIRRIDGSGRPVSAAATVEDWGLGFDRYLAGADHQVSRPLVERAQGTYRSLATTQRRPRLLHGDLHHYNVLYDTTRGWLAIDPKGVIGEVEYEIGASLRNPYERPDLFATPQIVARRLKIYDTQLHFDTDRALRWAFAQAVLSALWSIEDGSPVDESSPALMLARAAEALLGEPRYRVTTS